METTHTPGPWQVSRSFNKTLGIKKHGVITEERLRVSGTVGSPCCGTIADLGPTMHTPPLEIQQANACLIAAAPDLLQACKDADKAYKAVYPKLLRALQDDGEGGTLYFAMRKIEAAIANAKGA